MTCLTPLGIEKLKKMLTTDGSKLSQLIKLDTETRKAKIIEFMGKENSEYINYEIEKKLVAKTTAPLISWVEREVMAPHIKSDILKRINKLSETVTNKSNLDYLSNDKARESLIEDLIAHKLGVGTTSEETALIMELAKKAGEARTSITELAGSKTPYGKVHSLMAKGVPLEKALSEAGMTLQKYESIIKKRAEAGASIYQYIDYMDKLKQESESLKLADWSKDWWVASQKLGKEIFDSIRGIMASGELGFIFRQGLKSMYKDPRIWLKNSLGAMNEAIKGVRNINFKAAVMAEIITRPNYLSGHYAEARLAINTVEDYYKNAWIERIFESDKPNIFQNLGQRYIKFSQDTYLTFLYKTRADLFDAHWEKLQEAGADYVSIGELFNNLTGRGTGIIGGEGGKKGFGEFFMFAAKYTQSQINALTKVFDPSTNNAVRVEYFKNLATLLAGTSLVLFLSSLFGLEVEEDPRSTKFGKIIFPNGYVMDITGGLTAYVILLSRLMTGETKTNKGKVVELGGFGRPDAKELISNFMFSKGSPQVSLSIALLNRELFAGQELTPTSLAASMAPIYGQEASDKITDKDLEVFEKLLLTSSAFFGLSSYDTSNPSKQPTQERGKR